MTESTPPDLATLAQGYRTYVAAREHAQVALDVAGVDAVSDMVICEVTIDPAIYELAMTRARHYGIPLAPVGRAILFRAAVVAKPSPLYDPTKRPPLRRTEREMKVWRFQVPRLAYHQVAEKITLSNCTVSSVVEDGLKRYAHDGSL